MFYGLVGVLSDSGSVVAATPCPLVRSAPAGAASALDVEDLVDHLGPGITALRRLASREVEREAPVSVDHFAMLIVKTADVPQRAEAEPSGKPCLACEPGLA